VARIVPKTEAEGPGQRFAIWVKGCPLRCPGCCNPEMLPFGGGTPFEPSVLAQEVLGTPGIEGLTLLGGEPFAQPHACAELARDVRRQGLSVMVFSGYTLDELRKMTEPGVPRLLSATDLLVDGRFERDHPEPAGGRRWIGSSNQRMHFLSARYTEADPRMRAPNTIEIRLGKGSVSVHGWPQAAAQVFTRAPR
jgi:anaerobic ribonucleoside-triphosphate reductase activating protein